MVSSAVTTHYLTGSKLTAYSLGGAQTNAMPDRQLPCKKAGAGARGYRMRRVVAMLLSLLLGAGAVLAQTRPGSAPAAPASPAGQSTAKDNIAECMRLWDAQTHMTKQEWSATCKRVQSRLDNLKIENMDPTPKPGRKKRGS